MFKLSELGFKFSWRDRAWMLVGWLYATADGFE